MIFETGYSGRDIDAALKIALGQADWIGRNSNMIYALLLLPRPFSLSRSFTCCSSENGWACRASSTQP
jgi:hypothetical protein